MDINQGIQEDFGATNDPVFPGQPLLVMCSGSRQSREIPERVRYHPISLSKA